MLYRSSTVLTLPERPESEQATVINIWARPDPTRPGPTRNSRALKFWVRVGLGLGQKFFRIFRVGLGLGPRFLGFGPIRAYEIGKIRKFSVISLFFASKTTFSLPKT